MTAKQVKKVKISESLLETKSNGTIFGAMVVVVFLLTH